VSDAEACIINIGPRERRMGILLAVVGFLMARRLKRVVRR
jgi:hypothetical protein